MSEASQYQATQLLARVTLLERIVGMIVRESMLKAGKGAPDILAFGEVMKAFFKGRTPEGASEQDLNDAADRFFSTIASDIGSQESK